MYVNYGGHGFPYGLCVTISKYNYCLLMRSFWSECTMMIPGTYAEMHEDYS